MFLNNSKKGVSPEFAIVCGLVAILIFSSFVIFFSPGKSIQTDLGVLYSPEGDNSIEIIHSPENPEEGDTVSFVSTVYSNIPAKIIDIFVEDDLVETCTFVNTPLDPTQNTPSLYEEECTFSDSYSLGDFDYFAKFISEDCFAGICSYEDYKPAACELDSDGDDPSVAGSISFVISSQGGGMSKLDYCIDDDYLFEYYCIGEGSGGTPSVPPIETTFTGGKVYLCDDGCRDGKCLNYNIIETDPWSSENLCLEDSDGGNIPLIYGETRGQQGLLSDTCVIGTTLSEYYCDEDRALIEEIYLCENIWYFSDVETFVVENYENGGGGGSNNGCTENWDCTSWTTCINNQQTRICTDLNDCGTEDYKPELVRICDSGTTQLPEDEEEGGVAWEQIFQDIQSKPVLLFIIIISSIVIVGIISIIIINKKKKSIVGNLGRNVSEQN